MSLNFTGVLRIEIVGGFNTQYITAAIVIKNKGRATPSGKPMIYKTEQLH